MATMKKVPKGMKKLSMDSSRMEMPSKYDPRPSFSVGVEDLPQIEQWSAGKEYKVELKVKMESYKEEDCNGKTKKRACLRIIAIGSENKD